MSHAVILDYVRTPFTRAADPTSGKAPGQLAHVDPIDLFAALTKKLVERTGIDPKHVENLVLGCVHQEAEQGLNPARMVVLHKDSGLPNTVQGDSVDKFCGSAARAISIGRNDIVAGEANLIIAGGVQSMSRVPMGGWNGLINPKVYDGHVKNFLNMGATAENLAAIYKVTREEQEKFALDSHRKLAAAVAAGHYDDEIVPVSGVTADDNVRTDSTPEQLAKLKPAFKKDGTVTAATSSPITDGAAAVLMASEDFAKANNLPVLARILSTAGSGCDPEIMGLGPVEASKKALERAGLTMDDIDVVELNEAFAAQVLSVMKEWEKQGMKVAPEKLNIDGGAIALGHPLGASGARLVGHASKILQRTDKRYALATMCIGQGQGYAVVIENPNATSAPAPKL